MPPISVIPCHFQRVFQVSVQNGYLVFKDLQTFDRLTTEMSSKNRTFLDQWESQFNEFESQRNIFEELLDAEENIGASHSRYYNNNIHLFIVDQSDQTIRYNLPLSGDFFEGFVNKDGLVKIGNSLFKVDDNFIKEIRSGDESQLSLLDEIKETNVERGIVVTKMVNELLQYSTRPNSSAFGSDGGGCTGYTGGGGQRVIGKVYFGWKVTTDIYGNLGAPGQIVYKYYIRADATNQNKGIFSWNTKRTSQLKIEGHVTVLGGMDSDVDVGTGGDVVPSITTYFLETGYITLHPTEVFVSYSGNLTFRGRDGSNCSI